MTVQLKHITQRALILEIRPRSGGGGSRDYGEVP